MQLALFYKQHVWGSRGKKKAAPTYTCLWYPLHADYLFKLLWVWCASLSLFDQRCDRWLRCLWPLVVDVWPLCVQVIRKGEVSCCWICTTCKDNEYVQDEFTCKACELGWWPDDELAGRRHKNNLLVLLWTIFIHLFLSFSPFISPHSLIFSCDIFAAACVPRAHTHFFRLFCAFDPPHHHHHSPPISLFILHTLTPPFADAFHLLAPMTLLC